LSAQVVEKDLLIQEKEKLYMELKNILSRQPGPEVAEQLSIYQVCGCYQSMYRTGMRRQSSCYSIRQCGGNQGTVKVGCADAEHRIICREGWLC